VQLHFLGTAASEGYPDAFCGCENCERARALGGPSLRKRCSVLINDDLLIDLGPDLMAATLQHNRSLARLRYCLQTHEHEDHFDPSNLVWRSDYCGVQGAARLHLYASAGALHKATVRLGRPLPVETLQSSELMEKLNLHVHVVAPWQRFTAGPYEIFSVAANHAPDLTALLYVIEQGGRVLFYATDTGELPAATWQVLREQGRRFNVVAMDHTFGLKDRTSGHMNAAQFVEQIAQMRAHDLLAADVRIYAHHLAHHSNPPHPDLVQFAAARGYLVAYDGLVAGV
jgi:phosphoribosyl 1,2-cyclic phosphate phosphodiesterase